MNLSSASVQWILLLILHCYPSSSTSLNCGDCIHGTSLICPDYEKQQYEVKLFDDAVRNIGYLEITCQPNSTVDYSLLRDCSFPGVSVVKIKYCPFTNESLHNIITAVGVRAENVKNLIITIPEQVTYSLLPHHLQNLNNLEILNLDQTGFRYVDKDSFLSTPELKTLYLKGNNIGTLSNETFRSLSKLNTLNLNFNNFTNLPIGIFDNLHELKNLYLWKNQLKYLPPKIFQNLTLLQNLSLNNNYLESLSEDLFVNNIDLSNINFVKNHIKILPEGLFSNNLKLTSVKLSSNNIEAIPSNFFSTNLNLKLIYLQMNKIKQISESLFKNLSSIEDINISFNELKSLPPSLFLSTKEIQKIDLSDNQIEQLPPDIFQSTIKLKSLDLRNNSLTVLPQKLFINTALLEELDLSKNELVSLALNTFQSNTYSSLKKVDFSYNNLTSDNIFTFDVFALNMQRHLEKIDFSYNNFTGFPSQAYFFNFLKLKELNFEGNFIRGILLADLLELAPNVKVNLRFNRIATAILEYHIEDKTIQLYLEGNNFTCDCQLYDFISMIKRDASAYTRYSYIDDSNESNEKPVVAIRVLDKEKLICQRPSSFQNETLLNVDLFKLTCKLTREQCSEDCPCFYRNFDNMIIVDCVDQHMDTIPNVTFHANFNYTLDLTKNIITKFDFADYPLITNLTLSNNNLTEADLTINKTILPPKLKILDLSENNLTHLNKEFLTQINKTGAKVDLTGNPWICNCDLKFLHNFVQEQFSRVVHFREIYCLDRDDVPLVDLKEDDLCPFYLEPEILTTVVVFVVLVVLVAVIGTAALCQYKTRIKVWLFTHRMCLWCVTEDELDIDKQYDAFISFSHKDEDFVDGVLVPGLENGDPKYRLCLHYRDWLAGESIHHQIMESVHNSRRTLVILSNNFIESSWGQMEFRTAHQQAWEDKTNRVIIIVYGEMPPEESLDEELKHYVKLHTYLKWGDPRFWENLRYAMPHPRHLLPKGKKKLKAKVDRMELVNGHIITDNALRV